jgi:hypothetical protein
VSDRGRCKARPSSTETLWSEDLGGTVVLHGIDGDDLVILGPELREQGEDQLAPLGAARARRAGRILGGRSQTPGGLTASQRLDAGSGESPGG